MSSFFKGNNNNKDSLHNWYYNPSLNQLLYCTQDDKDKVQQVFDLYSNNNNNNNNDKKNRQQQISQTIIHPIEQYEYLTLNQINHLITNYHLRINSDTLVKCIRDLELHFINTFKVTTKNKKTKALELELLNSLMNIIDEKTIGYHKCLYNVASKIMDGQKGKYDLVFILVMTEIGTTYQTLFKKGGDDSTRLALDKKLDTLLPRQRFQICKVYAQLWVHFYTFVNVIQELHLALASESKSPETDKNTLALKTHLKKLLKIKKYIGQIHNNTPYYLRITSGEYGNGNGNGGNGNGNNNIQFDNQQQLILTEHESIITSSTLTISSLASSSLTSSSTITSATTSTITTAGVISSSLSIQPGSLQSSQISPASSTSSSTPLKFKLNYNQFTLFNQIHNDIKKQSTHLHLITNPTSSSSSNQQHVDMYIKTTIAPINEILSIYHSFLKYKSIKTHQCDFCQSLATQVTECPSCNINICILCNRLDKCIKCHVKNVPISVNVRLEGKESTPKLIILETTSFLDFNSQVFERFDIDKGMRIQCKLQDPTRQDIPLNSDINLHLALRSSALVCKMVNVYIMDPRINTEIPTISMTELQFKENGHIAEGGGGSISEVVVPSLVEYHDIPLVLKSYKLPIHDPEEYDPRSKINTIARSKYKFKREASLLSHIKSPYIIKMIAFVRDQHNDEMGIILEKAPLGSLDGKQFSNWELNILILLDVCKALSVVHSNGYIFQDLKPDNVLLFTESTDPDKIRCKLSDFGIVTKKKKKHNLGHTGVSHTFAYVAPEHNAQGRFNESIDIYAFGLLMFELLTKHRYQNRFNEPIYDWKDISLPLPVQTLLKLLLKTDVEMRLQSMKIVQTHLEKLLDTCKSEQWGPLVHPDHIPLRDSKEDSL